MSGRNPADIRRETVLAAAIFGVCVYAIGMAFEFRLLINHDVAFQLYAAREIVRGQQLYTDIYEFNLPPAYYLYVPAAWLSDISGVSIFNTFRVFSGLLIGMSATTVLFLVTRLPDVIRGWRFIALVALTMLAMTVYGTSHFGQREHFILILILPYVILRTIERSESVTGEIPLWLTIPIGMAAGYAVTVKPHFVVIPLLIESLRLWRVRRIPLDACNIALGITGGALLVEFMTLHYAEYIRLLPIVLDTAFDNGVAFRSFIARHIDMLPILALMLAVLISSKERLSSILKPELLPPLRTLALAALAALLAGLLQRKLWVYHFLPWDAFSIIWLGLMLVALRPPPHRKDDSVAPGKTRAARAMRVATTLSLILVLMTGISGIFMRNLKKTIGYGYFVEDVFEPYLRSGRGEGLMIFSPQITPNYYLALKYDRRWTSRFPYLWPLNTIANARRCLERDNCVNGEIAALLRNTVTEDMAQACPLHVIVFESGVGTYGWGYDFSFDTIGFFSADPRFARIWQHYEFKKTALHKKSMKVYRLYENRDGRCD